jgi:hypothetical protein
MHAVVVFESMYGNTQAIATAVAAGLATRVSVELVEVGTAPTVVPGDLELLVVGGPTHGHGLSKPETRQNAARKAPGGLVSPTIGVREWLDDLHGASPEVAAAAFDTSLRGPTVLWGSAARIIDKRLRNLGFRVIVPPESYHVAGPLGPVYDVLAEGEVERARAWGEELAAVITAQRTAAARR